MVGCLEPADKITLEEFVVRLRENDDLAMKVRQLGAVGWSLFHGRNQSERLQGRTARYKSE